MFYERTFNEETIFSYVLKRSKSVIDLEREEV